MKNKAQYLFTGGLLVTALLTNLAGCKKDEFTSNLPETKQAEATINGATVVFPNGAFSSYAAINGVDKKVLVLGLQTTKYQPFHNGKTLLGILIHFYYDHDLPIDSVISLPGHGITKSDFNYIVGTQYADGDHQEACDRYENDTLAHNWVKINSYDKESGLLCGEFGGKLCATQYYCKDFPEVLEITNGSFCVYMNK